jgi:hypothetical protein
MIVVYSENHRKPINAKRNLYWLLKQMVHIFTARSYKFEINFNIHYTSLDMCYTPYIHIFLSVFPMLYALSSHWIVFLFHTWNKRQLNIHIIRKPFLISFPTIFIQMWSSTKLLWIGCGNEFYVSIQMVNTFDSWTTTGFLIMTLLHGVISHFVLSLALILTFPVMQQFTVFFCVVTPCRLVGDTNVSAKHTVSIFRAEVKSWGLKPWSGRPYVSEVWTSALKMETFCYPKLCYLRTSLHGVTTQNNRVILNAVNLRSHRQQFSALFSTGFKN